MKRVVGVSKKSFNGGFFSYFMSFVLELLGFL